MPHYDEIGEFSLDQVLARRLTTPGGAVAPTVAPELFGTVALENDRPEWGYLKGERRMQRVITVAAVAAQFSAAQLYIPSTSRTIAIVTSIRSCTVNTFNVARLVGISGGLGGWAGYATTSCDFRWGAQGSAVLCETTNNVAQPSNNGAITQLTAAGQVEENPIVIAPNTALGIYAATVNQLITLAVSWYERPAQPGELL